LALTCLKSSGYMVLDAGDAASAMQIARQHPGQIHLLLTDVVMPITSGKDLAIQLTALRPEIKVLYMSGYTGDLIAHHGVLEEGTLLLEKPFTLHSLLSKVREALLAGASTKAATAQ
jgi:two-component system cell cycle sensor histidine kinase/response regulator CckA